MMDKSIVNADVRYSGFRAVFAFIDPHSVATAEVTVSTSDYISQLRQTNDGTHNLSHKWATFEPNLWLLDGSFDLLPDDLTSAQTGWWSEDICDDSGHWTDNPAIHFIFPEPVTSVGMTVIFDSKTDEYAEDFIISVYGETNTILVQEQVCGNALAQYVSEQPYIDALRISVEILKWHSGQRHARIAEVTAGIVEVYNSSNVVSASLINETNLLSDSLVSGELCMEIDNLARRFNFMNPKGIYRYLVDAYPIDVSIALGKNSDLQYVDCGRYYLYKSETEETDISAKIYARDRLYTLDLSLYRKGSLMHGSVYDLVADILTDAGQSGYQIDASLKKVLITYAVPLVSCREALRLAAQSAGAVVWVDKSDIIRVERVSIAEPQVVYNDDNCIDVPKPSISEYINTCDVVINTYSVETEETEIVNTSVNISGTSTFWVTYSGASANIIVQVTGASLILAECYLYAARLTVSGDGTASIIMTGRSVSVTESLYRIGTVKAETPRIYEIRNPLVTSSATAKSVAEWAYAMKQNRLSFEIRWRGDPSLNIGDTCEVHDRYGSSIRAIITRHEYSYDGTLSENTQATGGWQA